MSEAGPATVGATVAFLRRLIQTESLPGREGDAARLVRDEMTRLGYDEVRVDRVGNVVGTVRGRGAAAPIMLNAHLDHVGVGDHARWPYPPFAAEERDGEIWGRGAVDMKGPLAAQVHAAAGLLAADRRPPGDVHVATVVQEEIGGVGSRALAASLPVSVVVIGEPSSNRLRLGHRGRLELQVHFLGRSAHASVPDRARNPLESAAAFLLRLRDLAMTPDAVLGPSTVAPTLVRTDQSSPNVIPAEVWVTCDWRDVPREREAAIRDRLQRLAEACCIEGTRAVAQIPSIDVQTWTGVETSIPAHVPGFLTAADHPVMRRARQVLQEAIGLDEAPDVYRFATDGGLFRGSTTAVIGFGPGDGLLAHTVDERIAIDDLARGVQGFRALAAAGLSREV